MGTDDYRARDRIATDYGRCVTEYVGVVLLRQLEWQELTQEQRKRRRLPASVPG
jgi:hypothetical protein